jgi:hypothetical protein
VKHRAVRSSEIRRNRHLSLVPRDYVDPEEKYPPGTLAGDMARLRAAWRRFLETLAASVAADLGLLLVGAFFVLLAFALVWLWLS